MSVTGMLQHGPQPGGGAQAHRRTGPEGHPGPAHHTDPLSGDPPRAGQGTRRSRSTAQKPAEKPSTRSRSQTKIGSRGGGQRSHRSQARGVGHPAGQRSVPRDRRDGLDPGGDVAGHWNELALALPRQVVDGKEILYQEGTLWWLMAPRRADGLRPLQQLRTARRHGHLFRAPWPPSPVVSAYGSRLSGRACGGDVLRIPIAALL